MAPSSFPQHCPSPQELDDLELIVRGYVEETGFNQPGSPLTLHLPPEVDDRARTTGAVELVDPEGLPLARVDWPGGRAETLSRAEFGPFRAYAVPPAEYHARWRGRTVVPVTAPVTRGQLDALRALGPLTLLALSGTGSSHLSPVGLVRATLAASRLLPDAIVVTAPLARHDLADADADTDLRRRVVAAYGENQTVLGPVGGGDELPPEVEVVVEQDRPRPSRQGLVVFFTGLSGSGKSTIARALVDRLLEHGVRTVTSLDGDVVRRHLSAGLTFSREDRETNIRRIGWVAAEIARHGGVAVVSPIAPFDETRQQVRAMVHEAGGAFFLVHVATPLEECERRDRKGLYAKARHGEIPEFTGISSPYEEPTDADVRVDTTGLSVSEALDDVLDGLRAEGYLDLRPEGPTPLETASDPLRVLFVCTANICRSPAMEAMAKETAGPGSAVEFSSAGTHGFVDHPMDAEMAAALPGGIDVSAFRSRRLTAELLEGADLVLTAEATHRSFILDDHPGMFRKVYSLGQFAQTLERAPSEATGHALVAHVATARGNADTSLDVSDPYRRGPEAAAACVADLQRLLGVVLPALTR